MDPFEIDPDITAASTLHADAYRDPARFEASRDRIFARSWQLLGDAARVRTPGSASPHTLLDGMLSEPLLLTRDADDALHCLSNVCTHRGTLVCEGDTHAQQLRCRYHGRRFALDGSFLSMPGFEGARSFPAPSDSLPKIPLERWGRWLFASLRPAVPFAEWIGDAQRRLAFLPLDSFAPEPALARDYLVQAHWALYVENYLEGFHVPFVHPALSAALDPSGYRTELFRLSSLQVGIAASPGDAFTLPAGHPDHGQAVAAYYWWLWPNLMLNFYPWGLSANVVTPLAPDRCRVSYLAWVLDRSRLGTGAGGALDRVEREDEEVVESVQRGLRSRLYSRGRYSPKWETGVHHFHRLLGTALR
ncbi:MAG: aromatic ring-hydroxylating dioxygenase subunit alpha [Candidatus Brocadiae bacterium]|nr:aromatic ring-hydroxylating dioxygenase subunit alpha [Candidatus Brocadiia bacterium]